MTRNAEVDDGRVLGAERTNVEAGDDDKTLARVELLTGLNETVLELRERESLLGNGFEAKFLGY